jgi:hypothetical protein
MDSVTVRISSAVIDANASYVEMVQNFYKMTVTWHADDVYELSGDRTKLRSFVEDAGLYVLTHKIDGRIVTAREFAHGMRWNYQLGRYIEG